MTVRAVARLASATVAVGVLAFAVLLPAPASAAQPCVGVVVDARLLGAGVSTGCAEGDPDSGLDALTRAGFSYSFVPRQPGLVCQIDGLPECARTGATTYWSYWHKAKGSDRWTYSTVGAAQHDPAPGSLEAWVWQDGGRREPPDLGLREVCPQAFSATRSAAPTRSRSPSQSATATRADAGSTRSSATSAPAKPETQMKSSNAPAPSSSVLPSDAQSAPPGSTQPDTGSTGATTASPSTSPVAAAGRGDDAGDSPAGLAAGIVLIAGLAAAAAWRARHRGGGAP